MADGLSATELARLAFEGCIKGGAAELTKELTAAGITKLTQLRDAIGTQFRAQPDMNAALVSVEGGDEDALAEVITYLKVAMKADAAFAQLVQGLGVEIQADITAQEIERLKVIHHGLQSEWTLKNELLQKLRKARAIEVDTATKFKLDQQIPEAEAELADLTRKLQELERELPEG